MFRRALSGTGVEPGRGGLGLVVLVLGCGCGESSDPGHRGLSSATALRGETQRPTPRAEAGEEALAPIMALPADPVDAGRRVSAAASEPPSTEDPAEETPALGFFVSSVGLGRGGDLGGLAGADTHCGELAAAVGAVGRTWRALLSTDSVDGRDRIGEGPWFNANGVRVANGVAQLFSVGVPLGALRTRIMVDEAGVPVPSSSHDILTGTADDGGRIIGGNCQAWTSSAEFDAVVVGHSDNSGAQGEDQNKGWVAAHLAISCSAAGVAQDGGDGRIYCFAAD